MSSSRSHSESRSRSQYHSRSVSHPLMMVDPSPQMHRSPIAVPMDWSKLLTSSPSVSQQKLVFDTSVIADTFFFLPDLVASRMVCHLTFSLFDARWPIPLRIQQNRTRQTTLLSWINLHHRRNPVCRRCSVSLGWSIAPCPMATVSTFGTED
jgi:hypothetical protein